MSIGEKIYELRKKKNMSQEELAQVLNVSRQTISKWETGESNPDFDKIVPLCNFFELSTDEFLKGNNPFLEKELVRVNKKNQALTISLCIVIFIVMNGLVIIFDETGMNDSIIAIISLVGLGSIAIILVYYFLSKPLGKIKTVKSPNLRKYQLLNSIINLLIIIVYIVLSCFFGWAYTWIVIIVGLLIKKLFQLIFLLRGDENEK